MKPKQLDAAVAKGLKWIKTSAGDDLSRFPDFLILGPQRTGSSWLFRRLATHPEVFIPAEKETYYFSTLTDERNEKFRYATLSEFLRTAMVDSPVGHLRKLLRNGFRYRPHVFGESTASNATLPPEIIREICSINPEIKAIIVLRNPEGRVRSHAKKALTAHTGRRPEEVGFEEYDHFLRARGQLAKANYRQIIQNWRAALAPGNLMIAEFRRVAEAPVELLTEVQKFLGVDHERLPGLRELQAKVYSTGSGKLPTEVEARIQELYGAAIRDYDLLLNEFQSAAVIEGCYRV